MQAKAYYDARGLGEKERISDVPMYFRDRAQTLIIVHGVVGQI